MSTARRVHNGQWRVEFNLARKYKQGVTLKPRGLWYGIGDSWLEWCRSEMPQWVHPYNYEIDTSRANILVLRNPVDMLAFNRRYKRDYYQEGGKIVRGLNILRGVDWPEVAKEHDGIEIPRYFGQYRLDPEFFWYYGFDCACGCVWNLENVKIEFLEEDQRQITTGGLK